MPAAPKPMDPIAQEPRIVTSSTTCDLWTTPCTIQSLWWWRDHGRRFFRCIYGFYNFPVKKTPKRPKRPTKPSKPQPVNSFDPNDSIQRINQWKKDPPPKQHRNSRTQCDTLVDKVWRPLTTITLEELLGSSTHAWRRSRIKSWGSKEWLVEACSA